MSAIFGFLATIFTRIFADKVVGWIAFKAVLVFLLITVLPILLNNFIYDLIEIVMDASSSGAGDISALHGCSVTVDSSGVPTYDCSKSFSGVVAYFMQVFAIPECFSVIFSSLSIRTALKMIPFVRL